MLALFNSKFSKWKKLIRKEKMFQVLAKVSKIRNGIVPVPLLACNRPSSRNSVVSCKYFNEVCDYNDLIRLLVYSAVFQTRIKLVLRYNDNSFHSFNNSLLSFDYGVPTNPLFSIVGFGSSSSTSRWLKCFSKSMSGFGRLTTWPRESGSQDITIPGAFIKLERLIAKRLS